MPDTKLATVAGHVVTASKLTGAAVLPIAVWLAFHTKTTLDRRLLSIGSLTVLAGLIAWARAPVPADSRLLAVVTVVALGLAASLLIRHAHRGLVGDVALAVILAITTVSVLTQQTSGTAEMAWTQRGSGSFLHPNMWAAALVVGGPPFVFLASARDRKRRFFAGFAVLVITIAILQSASRAAIAVWALAVSAMLTTTARRSALPGVLTAAIVAPWLTNVSGIALRIQSLFVPSIETEIGHASLAHRFNITQVTWSLIWEHPVVGGGFGTLAPEVRNLTTGIATSPHNAWLGAWVEQGLLGLVAWCLTLGLGAWCLVRLRSAAQTPQDHAWWRGLAIGLTSWALLAFTLDLGTFKFGWLLLGIIVGSNVVATGVTLTSESASTAR